MSCPRWLVPCLLVLVVVAGCGEEPAGPPPGVTGVEPVEPLPGSQLVIKGQNLGSQGGLEGPSCGPLRTVAWGPSQVIARLPDGIPPGQHQLFLTVGGSRLGPVTIHVRRPAPRLDSVEPARGKVGEMAVVTGQHLGPPGPTSRLVALGTLVTQVAAWSDTSIQFRIPRPSGTTGLFVEVGGTRSGEIDFVLARPVLKLVSPDIALTGTRVTLTGSDFGQVPGKVLFGPAKVGARVASWADRAIDAMVPDGVRGEIEVRVSSDAGPSWPALAVVLTPAPEGPIGPAPLVAKHAALALDGRGFPHILTFHPEPASFLYCRWTGLGWALDGLPSEVGTHRPDAARAPDVTGPFRQLMEQIRTAQGARRAELEAELQALAAKESKPKPGTSRLVPVAGYYPSLCIDARGALHYAAFDVLHQKIIYGVRSADGSTCRVQRVLADAAPEGLFSSLACDASGQPQIAFMAGMTGHLIHARKEGEGFLCQPADPREEVGVAVALAVDPKGRAHMAYLDYANFDLRYALVAGGEAHAERVDSEGWVGDTPSIAVDREGQPHIVYLERDGSGKASTALRYAVRQGTTWQVRTLDKGPDVAYQPAIVAAADGTVHITSLNAATKELRYVMLPPKGHPRRRTIPIKDLHVPVEPGGCRIAMGQDGRLRTVYSAGRPRPRLHYAVLTRP